MVKHVEAGVLCVNYFLDGRGLVSGDLWCEILRFTGHKVCSLFDLCRDEGYPVTPTRSRS